MPTLPRPFTEDERRTIEHLTHSRTEEARLVERAKIVWLASEGRFLVEIARELGITENTARKWLQRFAESGIEGLRDRPRSGHPPVYTSNQVAEIVATSLTRPSDLGLPFASWTLQRLKDYIHDTKAIAMKRSRIDQVLRQEGLRWRHEETWFGERVDPEFAKKRGSSTSYTRPRRKVRSSSV
jgi:transposase